MFPQDQDIYSKYDQDEFEVIGDMEKTSHSTKDPLIIHTVKWVLYNYLLLGTKPSHVSFNELTPDQTAAGNIQNSATVPFSSRISIKKFILLTLLCLCRFLLICRTAGRVITWRS